MFIVLSLCFSLSSRPLESRPSTATGINEGRIRRSSATDREDTRSVRFDSREVRRFSRPTGRSLSASLSPPAHDRQSSGGSAMVHKLRSQSHARTSGRHYDGDLDPIDSRLSQSVSGQHGRPSPHHHNHQHRQHFQQHEHPNYPWSRPSSSQGLDYSREDVTTVHPQRIGDTQGRHAEKTAYNRTAPAEGEELSVQVTPLFLLFCLIIIAFA